MTTNVTRRAFLSAALVGLTQKAGRRIDGGFVNESHERGHQLRDGGRFRRTSRTALDVGPDRRRRHGRTVRRLAPRRSGASTTSSCSRWSARRAATRAGARTRCRRTRGARITCRSRARPPASCARSSPTSACTTARRGTSVTWCMRPTNGCSSTADGRRGSSRRSVRHGAIAIRSRASRRAWRSCAPPGGSRSRWPRPPMSRGRRRRTRSRWPRGSIARASTRRGCGGWWTTPAAMTTAAWPATSRPGPASCTSRRGMPTTPDRSRGPRATAGSRGDCCSGWSRACAPTRSRTGSSGTGVGGACSRRGPTGRRTS